MGTKYSNRDKFGFYTSVTMISYPERTRRDYYNSEGYCFYSAYYDHYPPKAGMDGGGCTAEGLNALYKHHPNDAPPPFCVVEKTTEFEEAILRGQKIRQAKM